MKEYLIAYFQNLNNINNAGDEGDSHIISSENQEDAFNLASQYSKKNKCVLIFERNIIKDPSTLKVVAMYDNSYSDRSELILKKLLNNA